jgi:hypothetical protein
MPRRPSTRPRKPATCARKSSTKAKKTITTYVPYYAGSVAAKVSENNSAARRQLGTYFADLAVYYARLAKLLSNADDAI